MERAQCLHVSAASQLGEEALLQVSIHSHIVLLLLFAFYFLNKKLLFYVIVYVDDLSMNGSDWCLL